MNTKHLLACLCASLLAASACDSGSEEGTSEEGSATDAVDDDEDEPELTTGADDEADTEDEPEATTGADTEDEPEATTGADTEDEPEATTGASYPENCSCYDPAASGPLPEDGCMEFDEIFLGCEAAADDCGTFTLYWDTKLEKGAPDEADNAALDCVIEALGQGGVAAFTVRSPPEDVYGGRSDYSPLPGGEYGSYNCNTTNEGGNDVTIYAAPAPENIAACAEGADYFEKIDCVLDVFVEAEAPAMAACE